MSLPNPQTSQFDRSSRNLIIFGMHSATKMKSHLEHRLSILEAYISERNKVSRNGYNCYMDAAQITCRSLWGLLGVQLNSRKETDLKAPTATKLNFDSFQEIRDSIDPAVDIKPFKSESDIPSGVDREELILVLAAANKCVAHFGNLLDHAVDDRLLERIAKRTIAEIETRVKIP